MLIDHKLIEKAKEKLGDRNADEIAAILQVEQYNDRQHKSLCPFHHEDTPSFIYNAKKHCFHCFGACGTNTDIIDAYMHTGLTYLESVEKLFELAGIQYSFGEKGIQTKREHRYPKPKYADNKEKIYQYLETRKISKETADYLGLEQDEKGNILFRYWDTNDVLTMVKCRPSRQVRHGESKNWVWPDSDADHILFNINKINTDSPMLITCGELDCAAAVEAGFINAVSIPFGDGNTQWVSECWEFIDRCDEIIIAYDNDDSGRKFVKEIIPRLGAYRCKVVNLPDIVEVNDKKHAIKDLNEYLYWMGKEKLLDIITHAQDSPIPSLVDFADVDDIDTSELDGVQTGIEAIDYDVGRFFLGSFNILSGTPGSGKSTFLSQFMAYAMDRGYKCWSYSRELPAWQFKNWMLYAMSGPENLEQKTDSVGRVYWKVKPECKTKINEYYRDMLMLYRDDAPNSRESIQASMTDAARKYGTKLFVLDNLMMIDIGANENNKNEKQTDFVNWLIKFSLQYNVCVFLVVHPNKTQNVEENIGMYAISGTSNIINLAHRAIGLRRVTDREKQRGLHTEADVVLNIIKDRFTGYVGREWELRYDKASRRFYMNQNELHMKYGWDQNVSREKPLFYDEDVFGSIA